MIYVILVLCLSLTALIYIFYPPVAKHFPDWTAKATAIQTHFTFLGFLIGFIGIYKILENINKKYNPVILINGESTELNIKLNKLSQYAELNFYVFNKGKISLPKDDVYFMILIPEQFNSIKITDGITTPSGDKFIPKLLKHSRKGSLCLGGQISVRVMPDRKILIFTSKINFPKEGEYLFQYYFSTDIGFFPPNIIADSNNEPLKNLGEIKILVNKS